MSFFENTRRPVGLGGKLMVFMMSIGHRALAGWEMKFLNLSADAKVLDCGCGGGANIETLLKTCPKGIVKGVDYAAVSVEKAKKRNAKAIHDGRCVVWQGSVEKMVFAKDWFDAVTAFETVYFWPGLQESFREVHRVLKPDGAFLICNECGDERRGERWAEKIGGMTIYTAAQLKAELERAGFRGVQMHRNRRGWLCAVGRK